MKKNILIKEWDFSVFNTQEFLEKKFNAEEKCVVKAADAYIAALAFSQEFADKHNREIRVTYYKYPPYGTRIVIVTSWIGLRRPFTYEKAKDLVFIKNILG